MGKRKWKKKNDVGRKADSAIPKWMICNPILVDHGTEYLPPLNLEVIRQMSRDDDWQFALPDLIEEQKSLLRVFADHSGVPQYVKVDFCDECDALHVFVAIHGAPRCMLFQLNVVEVVKDKQSVLIVHSIKDHTGETPCVDPAVEAVVVGGE